MVQARMGSSRLPGKVLADLAGAPMLARVVERARRATRVTEVWVATSREPADDPIVAWAGAAGVSVVRGPEADVLTRFRLTAEASRAEVIVRLTADCPLLDPGVIDEVVAALTPGTEYATNVLTRSHPRGLDVEAFTAAALVRMDRLGNTAADREHVTLGPRGDQAGRFVSRSVVADGDDANLRWTVDTAEDLDRIRRCYTALGLATAIRPYREVVAWCRQRPDDGWTDEPHLTWDPRQGRVER